MEQNPQKKLICMQMCDLEVGSTGAMRVTTVSLKQLVFSSRKLDHNVNKSTVVSIKIVYLEEKESRAVGEEDDLEMLPPKKRGRRVLLDMKVQMYLKKVREGEG